jgi:hypothetical protein
MAEQLGWHRLEQAEFQVILVLECPVIPAQLEPEQVVTQVLLDRLERLVIQVLLDQLELAVIQVLMVLVVTQALLDQSEPAATQVLLDQQEPAVILVQPEPMEQAVILESADILELERLVTRELERLASLVTQDSFLIRLLTFRYRTLVKLPASLETLAERRRSISIMAMLQRQPQLVLRHGRSAIHLLLQDVVRLPSSLQMAELERRLGQAERHGLAA